MLKLNFPFQDLIFCHLILTLLCKFIPDYLQSFKSNALIGNGLNDFRGLFNSIFFCGRLKDSLKV